ncbi:BRCT domain-containing protein [Trypanosoma grayi]|uniref:BRCT domain-containing protein n=1 Tax=Trypanosoma grayi TaxID=71804 RepID=UPI0004F4506A|nr:BRCT domain-containing protein [Trypanosoma grayi]KEG06677.1 BRCT domain-containing protein [Trypanosoma grayi]
MTSKQERISEAMRERIAQLEEELNQCKHHLNEAVCRNESLESDIDAIQNEAHDVVGQWAAKAAELQTKVNESISQADGLRSDLLTCEKKNAELQLCLQNAEQTGRSQAEELHHLKETHRSILEKLAVAESDFCSASQRIIQYENLVGKMDLEMKQSVEDIRSFSKEKARLIEVVANLEEEKRRVEADCTEVRSLAGILENELTSRQRSLILLSCIMKLAEEEYYAREDIIFDWETSNLNSMTREWRHFLLCNSLLKEKQKRLEEDLDVLKGEKSSLEEGFQKTCAELCSVRQDHEKTKDELLQQVRLLERDVAELQDSQISQKCMMETLQERLDAALNQSRFFEDAKEGLETEFKAIKECYSALLLEHNELRVTEQKRQQELNAKITLLTDEGVLIRNDYEARLKEMMSEANNYQEIIDSLKKEVVGQLELKDRRSLEVIWYEECTQALLGHCAQLTTWLCSNHAQLAETMKTSHLMEGIIKENQTENNALREKLGVTEKDLVARREDLTVVEAKVVRLSSELKASKENYEEIVSDNNWLKEQVETMRRELSELDELLNSNLNDMREESEKQQLEHDRLIREVHRCEELLRCSQERIDVLDERCVILTAENNAVSKTLQLTEGEVSSLKKENALSQQREKTLAGQQRELESSLVELQNEYTNTVNQVAVLKEQLRTEECKLKLLGASSRQELEAIKTKMNHFIEKYEEAEQRASHLSKCLQESENTVGGMREAYQKAKTALEEAKLRCCSDADTIQKLLEERQSLINEREGVVEKYNRVHDMFKAVKKESFGRVADELQKLSELCSQQEVELQQLRHQNTILKRGIVKLPENAGNQIERPMFVERLNLAEGPLRRPKKRPAVSSDVQ